jgi:hypothetical protein
LPRAVENGRFDRFALLEVKIDVFGRDGRVVDEDADRAAVRRRQRRAGDSGKLRPDKIQSEIVKSSLR